MRAWWGRGLTSAPLGTETSTRAHARVRLTLRAVAPAHRALLEIKERDLLVHDGRQPHNCLHYQRG